MHESIDELGRRLAQRVARERAFSAHAAHALRTPLAGMDAQLAIALRESPPQLQARLKRVREAGSRLQRVIAALLTLFRSSSDVQRTRVDLAALIARLPVDGLSVEVPPDAGIDADPDLLAAVLLNLLDNAQRYGAHRVAVTVPASATLRLSDDGPGLTPERRRALQQGIEEQTEGNGIGLGLRLADLVARAHGGRVVLQQTAQGFAVDLHLNDAGAAGPTQAS